MQKIGERQYAIGANETVAIEVDASGTAHLVNYDLDGDGGILNQGQQLSITAPSGNNRRKLNLLFTYSGSGGTYTVKLTGSAGGQDTDTVSQGSFGVPTNACEYRFRRAQ